jgi:hypothetical protein
VPSALRAPQGNDGASITRRPLCQPCEKQTPLHTDTARPEASTRLIVSTLFASSGIIV